MPFLRAFGSRLGLILSLVIVSFLLTLLVLVMASFRSKESEENGVFSTPRPFCLEAQFTRSSTDSSTKTGLFWWYEANDKFRWELQRSEDFVVLIADGLVIRQYDSSTSGYREFPASQIDDDTVLVPPGMFAIGPLNIGSIDAFVLEREQQGESVRVAGDDRILNRSTYILDIEASGETLRVWIDKQSGFLLRFESKGPDGDLFAGEVQRLVFDWKPREDIVVVSPAAKQIGTCS